jgi:hypothetical protein
LLILGLLPALPLALLLLSMSAKAEAECDGQSGRA